MWHHKAEITYNFADNKKIPTMTAGTFYYAKRLLKYHYMVNIWYKMLVLQLLCVSI